MIVVTAASGRYGSRVVEALLRRGMPAAEVVAAARDTSKLASLREADVGIRAADWDRPDTLATAFDGAARVLLVPSADPGKRHPQMQAAINAAVRAGIGTVFYASFINTGRSTPQLGAEHKLIEVELHASGLDVVVLRNGAHTEMYTESLGHALEHGVILGSAGDGQISGATRADLADAAATALIDNPPGGTVYELAGPDFTLAELAAEVTRQTGTPVAYQDLSQAEYAQALISNGLPAPFARLLADTSAAIARGDWHSNSTDLADLIGRQPTPMSQAVTHALAAITGK